MNSIAGLHHVTAIASNPQRNLDFYTDLIGLRFVKKTVNFDDPGTYHFYFGDDSGTPGTILTFFSLAARIEGAGWYWRGHCHIILGTCRLHTLLAEAFAEIRHKLRGDLAVWDDGAWTG